MDRKKFQLQYAICNMDVEESNILAGWHRWEPGWVAAGGIWISSKVANWLELIEL